MTDPVIEMLDALGLPATRQNYIDLNWSPLPDPWTPDDESELPEELQDWTRFEVQDGELVTKGATRDAGWETEPRKGKGPGGGEWTKGGGGGGAAVAEVRTTKGKKLTVHLHQEPPMPEQVRQLENRGGYDVTTEESKASWAPPGTRIVRFTPQKPPGWEATAKGGVYDPNYAEEEGGYIRWKEGVSSELPAKPVAGSIWRGMSQEEYRTALKQGFIQSLGDFNIGSAQKGLTYYSSDPRTAASYAHGFAPWQYAGTITQPPVVVRIKDPGGHVAVPGAGEDEIGIKDYVPISAIQEVWQGKPISAMPGMFEIDPEGKLGSGSAPQTDVVWEKQSEAPLTPKELLEKMKSGEYEKPPSERIIAHGPGLDGEEPLAERYLGVGDKEFTGPHAMMNALRTGRLLNSGVNRHAVEATMKKAGLKLVDPTDAPAKVASVFRLEAYPDGAAKSNLWYDDTPKMAQGLADALAKIGAPALEKELKTNVNVVFASYDRQKTGTYGAANNPIAAVWGDKAGEQWLVINTANTLDDDWSPGEYMNTVGAQNAKRVYDAEIAKTPPEKYKDREALHAAQAVAMRDAMIHEFGHVLDNVTGQGLRKALHDRLVSVTHGSLGVDKAANDWMRQRFSDYAATNPAEATAEVWTMAMTRPEELPKELSVWTTAALSTAIHGAQA